MAWRRIGMALTALALAAPASAAGLPSSCTLTLTTSGKMEMSGDGMTMSSQVGGGLSAIMALVAVNLTPRLTFSPLTVLGPTGWSGTPAGYLALDTLSGSHIPYTMSGFSITPGILLDTLTFNAKIVNPGGFRAGSYSAGSTVTCEAA